MRNDRLFIDYLQDILDAADKATHFVSGMSIDDFAKDEKTQFAVIRALEIIGEATKKIPQDVKDSFPEIPWREMAGTRDKVIHDYIGINLVVVWKTVIQDLPALIPLIHKVLTNYLA